MGMGNPQGGSINRPHVPRWGNSLGHQSDVIRVVFGQSFVAVGHVQTVGRHQEVQQQIASLGRQVHDNVGPLP